MWAFGFGSPKGERLIYRGLHPGDLQASSWLASWDFSHSTRAAHPGKL